VTLGVTKQEIVLVRTIQALRSRVYDAFTTVEGWCAWCCDSVEVEARCAGKLHIYSEGYNAYGEFSRLIPDQAVSFSWDGDGEPPTLISVQLDEQEDGTVVTFAVTSRHPYRDWGEFGGFLERTWGRALDNLKAVLESEPATGRATE
jgi:uncharacterized protein YndB with AHSA1/START domain